MTRYELPKSLSRDGVTITDDTFVIHQRTMGKGDITIPIHAISSTEVKNYGQEFLFKPPFFRFTKMITIREGSKKHVVRRIRADDMEDLVDALNKAMSPGGDTE